MGETSDQIERHIQETRNDLSENFSELEEKVKTAVDWRAQFEERPVTMMVLAFGGGVLLSALLPSVRSSRRRSSGGRWSAPPDRDAAGLSIKSRTAFDGKASQTLETWDAIKGAVVGVATSKLSGFIEDLLPGFKQEFTKAQTGKSSDRSGSSTSGQPTWQKSTAAGAD
jgi:hypothetical protein